MFFKFLCDKATLHSSLLSSVLWKSLCTAHTLQCGQQYSTSSSPECLCKLSLILLHGNIISFPHLFIYSLIYLFIGISMDLQVNILYYWLQPSTSLFFFVAQIITALAIGSISCWFLFHWHMPLFVFLLCFEHILTFWTR